MNTLTAPTTYFFFPKNEKINRKYGSKSYDLVISKIENNLPVELGVRKVNTASMMGFDGEVNAFLIEKGLEQPTERGNYYHYKPEQYGYQIIEIGRYV